MARFLVETTQVDGLFSTDSLPPMRRVPVAEAVQAYLLSHLQDGVTVDDIVQQLGRPGPFRVDPARWNSR